MLLTILPFLLVARVDDNPYERPQGQQFNPECTYDVLVNMSTTDAAREDGQRCSMISAELKCRARGSDSLSCRFHEPRIARARTRCWDTEDLVPAGEKFLDQEPFEIRFNERGIENLVVRRNIKRWRLDMIKSIVRQLNVGFDIEAGRRKYTVLENSTVGSCEVEIAVTETAERGRDVIKRPEGMSFEIVFDPPRPGLLSGDGMLEIHKVRHPKVCSRKTMYFFGNHANYSAADNGVYTEMVSSVSRMTISKTNFESYTVTEGITKTANGSRITWPRQKISLSLRSIHLIRTPLPTILNPASTSLHTYSNLQY